jgi:hypothetical protein
MGAVTPSFAMDHAQATCAIETPFFLEISSTLQFGKTSSDAAMVAERLYPCLPVDDFLSARGAQVAVGVLISLSALGALVPSGPGAGEQASCDGRPWDSANTKVLFIVETFSF